MLVVLRHSQTKLYYGRHGKWVANLSSATPFQGIDEALLFNQQAHLENTEVLIIHSNGLHKVTLPIGRGPWANTRWNVPGTAIHSVDKRGRFLAPLPARKSKQACRPGTKGASHPPTPGPL